MRNLRIGYVLGGLPSQKITFSDQNVLIWEREGVPYYTSKPKRLIKFYLPCAIFTIPGPPWLVVNYFMIIMVVYSLYIVVYISPCQWCIYFKEIQKLRVNSQ